MEIIEHRQIMRDYGFMGNEVIADHPKHGRILIVDGFGGMGDIEGGCVRWKHGAVYTLLKNDNFEILDEVVGEGVDRLALVLKCYDDDRPMQEWPGYAIDKMMSKYGF